MSDRVKHTVSGVVIGHVRTSLLLDSVELHST